MKSDCIILLVSAILVSFVSSFGLDANRLIGDPQLGDMYSWDVVQNSMNESEFIIIGLVANSDPYIAKIVFSPSDESVSVAWSIWLPCTPYGYFNKIIETKDNHFAIAGMVHGYDGDEDNYKNFLFAKFNSSGGVVMSKVIGSQHEEVASTLVEAANGDFLIAGYVYDLYGTDVFDALIIRISSVGDIIWEKTIGGDYNDYVEDIIELSNGDIVVAGSTTRVEYLDVLVIKMQSDSTFIWAKSIGGLEQEEGWSVLETHDGDIVVSGYSNSYEDYDNNDGVAIIHKMSVDTGESIWSKFYGWKRSNMYTRYEALPYKLIENNETQLVMIGSRRSRLRSGGSSGTVIFASKLTQHGSLITTRITSRSSEVGYGIHLNRGLQNDSSESYTIVGISEKLYGETNSRYAIFGLMNSELEICESSTSSIKSYSIGEGFPSTNPGNNFAEDSGSFLTVYPDSISLGSYEQIDPSLDGPVDEQQTMCVYCNDILRDYITPNAESGCDQGYCRDSGVCLCDERYIGDACDVYDTGPFCGYYRFDDPYVCSGEGTCVDEDTCVCDDGYKLEEWESRDDQCLKDTDLTAGETTGIALGIVALTVSVPCLFVLIFCYIVCCVLPSVLCIVACIALVNTGIAAAAKKKKEREREKSFMAASSLSSSSTTTTTTTVDDDDDDTASKTKISAIAELKDVITNLDARSDFHNNDVDEDFTNSADFQNNNNVGINPDFNDFNQNSNNQQSPVIDGWM